MTLDEDVASRLKAEARRTGKPIKAIVNEGLRVAFAKSLVDANVLLYAYNPRAPQHERCRAWVEKAFSGDEPVCLS